MEEGCLGIFLQKEEAGRELGKVPSESIVQFQVTWTTECGSGRCFFRGAASQASRPEAISVQKGWMSEAATSQAVSLLFVLVAENAPRQEFQKPLS